MRRLFIISACLASSSFVFANESQQTKLNPMVVTATRGEVSVADAPAAITVITAEEIKQRGATNVLEALRGTPGVSLNGRQVGGRKTISIRGAEDRHTLVLIDGRRISSTDDTIGHSDYQYGWVAMDQIERIEVVRGPMSALYGSEAVGGVINIITKKSGDQWHANTTLRGEVGDGRTGNGHQMSVNVSGPVTDWLSLAVGVEDMRRSPTPWLKDSSESEIEGQDRQAANLGLTVTPIQGQEISLNLLRSDEQRKSNDYNRTRTTRYVNTYQLDSKQDSVSWRSDWGALTTQIGFSRSEFEVTNQRTAGVAPTRPQALRDDVWDFSTGFDLGQSHSFTLGAEHRQEHLDNAGLVGGSDSMTHKAVFAQDQIRLADDWSLILGARMDEHEEFGRETSPRAWVVWNTTPELTLKAGYGEAFRAPTLKQISPSYIGAEGPHTFLGNASVKPETSRSYEIGADWRSEQGTYTANLFRNDIDDLIYTNQIAIQGPRRTYQYDNMKKARINGLELTGSRELGGGFTLSSTINWLDARDATTKEKLDGRPKHSATAALDWVSDQWGAHLALDYTGRQYLAGVQEQERAPAYSLLSTSMSYQVNEQLALRLGVNNLTNLSLEKKSDLFGYVEPGRTGWLAVEASF